MNVLVVTNDFPPRVGGIQTYVHEIFTRLDDDITVVASTSPGAATFDRTFRHRVVRLPTSMLLPTPRTLRRVAALARSIHPDVIVFGASMPLALMGPSLHQRLGVPYVAFTHGLEVAASRVPLWRTALAYSLRRAAAVTAVSSWTADVLRHSVGDGRVRVLPNGVDTTRFHVGVRDADIRARHGLDDALVVGCVSRLVPRKGQDVLLAACAHLTSAVPNLRVLIVGSGPDLGRLQAIARRLGMADRVVFAGEVTEAELPMYFRAADIFAMPCRSRWAALEVEAFGAVYLQAAAVGRPVIAGRSGGTSDALRNGETGILVDASRTEEVVDALRHLLQDRTAAAAMGDRGAEWARSRCGWDQVAADARRLFLDAAAKA
ncbi:MAG: glycosyltransferase family 4 protein [Acidobacteriota bacterium]